MVLGYTTDILSLSGFQVNKTRKLTQGLNCQRKEKLLLTLLTTKREIQFRMALAKHLLIYYIEPKMPMIIGHH